MSDLLKKKSNLLQSSNKINPENTFDRSTIFTVDDSKAKGKPVKKKNDRKRTSIGCFQDTANWISAIGTIIDAKNADEVLELLINNYTPTLSSSDQSEIKTIKKILDRKK